MIENNHERSVRADYVEEEEVFRPNLLLNKDLKFKNVCQLFEEQAKKRPDKIAVIFKNKKLTYKELDKRSNQVARYLQQHGVQTETFVGLSLYNSLDLIVGVLGILKAGGVYVPLEPSYPIDRIDYMLKDAKPSILLTELSLSYQFTNFPGEVIRFGESWEAISTLSCDPLDITSEPRHLAYVIYTSGSTGAPKGIMVEHASFAHSALAHQAFYPSELIGLLSGAISFDVSILVIFHLLLSGGTICIPPNESMVDTEQLIELIEHSAINYLLCVPSLYSMILDKSRKLPSLKIVSLTGENISNSIIDLHPQFAPNAILYNEYGPTEYAIGTTLAKIYDPEKQEIYPVNVGRPLPDTYVYILDNSLRPVLGGTKGEIFIGGAGLARGYLNKPELTSERFISFQSIPLYRTGDFGRFRPDGNLEFLGRMDHQVKIRGNRVELGEIEYVIYQHPKINEAVVIVHEESNEDKRLAAYFTVLGNAEMKQELRTHLANRLPRYMIPSVFVQLQSFPRTPNGKIDRNALSNFFEKEKQSLQKTGSELEQALSEIWKQVLHLDSISTEDNFFDLGGDSLGIARMQTLIKTNLTVTTSVAELLQYPTISQLAQHLTQPVQNKTISLHKILGIKREEALQQFKTKAGRWIAMT